MHIDEDWAYSPGGRRWWITVVVVAVAVGITVALTLTLTGGSSGDPGRYGRRAVDVIHELHLCDQPEVLSDSTASCQFQGVPGGVAVSTSGSETEQNFLVAMVKDTMSACTVVVKGYLVDAPTVDMLTRAIGLPEAFAAKHHGYLVGRCN